MGMWVTGAWWQAVRGSSGRGLSVLAGRFGVDTLFDLWVATPTTPIQCTLHPAWLFFDPEHKGTMMFRNIRNHLANTLSCS